MSPFQQPRSYSFLALAWTRQKDLVFATPRRAAGYDYGIMPGRSLPRHEAWLARLSCPVLLADGDVGPVELTRGVLARIIG